jgi:hypothetical protein
MAGKLALVHLYDSVIATFAEEGTAVPNLFGWTEPDQKLETKARIIWVPGDDESGEVGEQVEARQPGRNPRSLGTLIELFTIYIATANRAQPEKEISQYIAARELWDTFWRAAFLVTEGEPGTTLGKPRLEWLIDRKVRRFGAALRVVCSVEAMIADVAHATAPADLEGELAVEFDVSEEQDATELVATTELES